MNQSGNFGVLLGDPVVGVDQNQADVGTLDGADGAHIGILFNLIVDFALAPHSGGVDQAIAAGFIFIIGVNGVPGGAGDVGDNDPLLAQNLVEQAGLAHIGLAYDGYLDDVALVPGFFLFGNVGQYPVQQIAGAVTVNSGGFKEVADTKTVEFKHIGIYKADGVAFVHGKTDGLFALAQHGGHILIRCRDAGTDIHHHNDSVRQLDADFRLPAHEFQHFTVRVRLDAAGVHQREGTSAPLAIAVDSVAGDARGIFNDGGSLAGQLIKQHGFTHVWPPHNGDKGFCHGDHSFQRKNYNISIMTQFF